MSGSSYHERMINASKVSVNKVSDTAQVVPPPIQASARQAFTAPAQAPSVSETVPAFADIAKFENVALVQQNVSFPVLSINWAAANSSAIEKEVVDALKSLDVGAGCFLDMSVSDTSVIHTEEQLGALISVVMSVIARSDRHINLLAAVHCSDSVKTNAVKAAGLKILKSPLLKPPADSQFSVSRETPAVPIESSPPASARVHYGTVRSGMQIYAEGCSLVIVGSVNNGAEVMADGDIHIYGTLMGRAVAGIGGSAGAHIFTRSFDASLVAVYDAFIAPDSSPELKKLRGKEVSLRLLKSGESVADVKAGGSQVVDCGSGKSLVVSTLN